MGTGGLRVGHAAGVALIVVGGTAAAQVERSPDKIRSCLCMEQTITTTNEEVQAQSRAYDQQRQAFEDLDKAIQTTRPLVNVNNPADVAAFQRLLAKRDDAADTLAGPASRSYAEAMQRYNQAVSAYNNACTGKAFDPEQLTAVKQALSCH